MKMTISNSFTNSNLPRLNGYRATHRNKWRFIQHGILSSQELMFLDFCSDIMSFGKDNPTRGSFRVNFDEIKKILRCKSENTIRNWLQKLLSIGFVQKTEKRLVFKLSCYERYLVSGSWHGESAKYASLEKNQSIDVILQNFGIDFQRVGEKFQPVGKKGLKLATNISSRIISSSNVDPSVVSGSSKKILVRQTPRTEKEYQQFYEEGSYVYLTPEDMGWIDENVTEEIEISGDEMEKNVVELFFGNDWINYRRHLKEADND